MSRLYEALQRMETERRPPAAPAPPVRTLEFLSEVLTEKSPTEEDASAPVEFSPGPRLVALADSHGLGAEKFRALATRLENLRRQREMKSLQITSSVLGEGKTVVSANLAATIAQQAGAKVLLVEGDLYRPALTPLFGLTQLRGLTQWWSDQDGDIKHYVHRMKNLSLWLLNAGGACDQPSPILRSPRFVKAFARLTDAFDWIIVDSAPMSPTITANLWSRLVDGTLLVVREGVASVKELKKGVEALDNPKLIGIVLNEASELRQAAHRYYPQTNEKAVAAD